MNRISTRLGGTTIEIAFRIDGADVVKIADTTTEANDAEIERIMTHHPHRWGPRRRLPRMDDPSDS